jgi:hypothetical protein
LECKFVDIHPEDYARFPVTLLSRVWIALNMLRSGVDIFMLQRLVGHADLKVLGRYLAKNDEDNHLAYMRGSSVDNNF